MDQESFSESLLMARPFDFHGDACKSCASRMCFETKVASAPPAAFVSAAGLSMTGGASAVSLLLLHSFRRHFVKLTCTKVVALLPTSLPGRVVDVCVSKDLL